MAVVSPVDAEVKLISEVLPPVGAMVQVHKPEPIVGVFPPKAEVVVPIHADLFPPLMEVVGGAFTVKVNDDEDGVQPAFEIVQVNV